MTDMPKKLYLSLIKVTNTMQKVISFAFDPKTGNLIPLVNGKKSPKLLEVFLWARSYREFVEVLSKKGFAFEAHDSVLALSGKLDEIVYGDM